MMYSVDRLVGASWMIKGVWEAASPVFNIIHFAPTSLWTFKIRKPVPHRIAIFVHQFSVFPLCYLVANI